MALQQRYHAEICGGGAPAVPDTAMAAASMSVPGQQSIELLPATS